MTTRTANEIEQRLKARVSNELETCRKIAEGELNPLFSAYQDILHARNRAFGALMFAANDCFEPYNEELADWWGDYALPEFDRLLASV